MKIIILKSIDALYRFIFRHEMSALTKGFLLNISWSFFGGVFSAGILLLTSILAGRFLGPTEYGKFNFISSISQILFVLLIFGMDRASLRFISQEKDKTGKSHVLSSALYFSLLNSFFIALIFVFSYRFAASFFKVESSLLLIALFYALAMAFRQLFNGFIRGLDQFKFQSVARILESLLILTLFILVLVFSNKTSHPTYFFALISGYFLFILSCIFRVRPYFTSFNLAAFKKQFSFAKLYFLATILGTLFGSLDKVVIAKYMSFYDLGVYGAYYGASINFAAQISAIWGNAFSTIFAQNLAKSHAIIKKLDRLTLILFFPALLLIMGFTTLGMLLLGDAYPFSFLYIASFSLLATLSMVNSMTALLTSIYSEKCIKMATLLGNISSLLFVGLFLILALWAGLSIFLVVLVLIAYNIVNILMCRYVLRREGAYSNKRGVESGFPPIAGF